MSANTEAQGSGRGLEAMKWVAVAVLLIVAIVGNYLYRDMMLPLRALAVVILIAAAGGVGKSFLLLSLAREIAAFEGDRLNAPLCFGGALNVAGTAVYVTAEDDAIEMHNRLLSLGPIPPNLVTLPLPDAGGAKPLFAPESGSRNPGTTVYWAQLTEQLLRIPQLRLIVLDPLQPLCALDLNVPENAQFVCSRLAALAASTGAKKSNRMPPRLTIPACKRADTGVGASTT